MVQGSRSALSLLRITALTIARGICFCKCPHHIALGYSPCPSISSTRRRAPPRQCPSPFILGLSLVTEEGSGEDDHDVARPGWLIQLSFPVSFWIYLNFCEFISTVVISVV